MHSAKKQFDVIFLLNINPIHFSINLRLKKTNSIFNRAIQTI